MTSTILEHMTRRSVVGFGPDDILLKGCAAEFMRWTGFNGNNPSLFSYFSRTEEPAWRQNGGETASGHKMPYIQREG
jgi:hypothetical protein